MPYRQLCNNDLPSSRLIPVAHVSCSSCALPHQQIRPWLLLKNTAHLPLLCPRDTQRVSQEGEKALKNEQKRQKSGYLRENSLAGRCWKEWKQRVAYGTVTPRWEK